jgi:hypothetical protein
MTAARAGHAATLLTDGRVLLAGEGFRAEIYDPLTKSFARTGNLTAARWGLTATLLGDGRVLIAGGLRQSSARNIRSVDWNVYAD